MTQELCRRLRELLDVIQCGEQRQEQTLPWVVWTSCSFRRIGSEATHADGDVLHAYNQRSDNHPDLSMSEDRLKAWVELTNALPALLDTIERLEGIIKARDEQLTAEIALTQKFAANFDEANQRALATEARAEEAAALERETCAKVADDARLDWFNGDASTIYGQAYQNACLNIAAAIRARGEG